MQLNYTDIVPIPAIIPARGGSKGVPGKNIKVVDGHPLLAYPIIAAQNATYIDKVYVSTDDKEIAAVAVEYGAKVINRPAKLAQDHSLDIEVMQHAVKTLGWWSDIVHLRATTPMIDSKVLDQAIEYYYTVDDGTSLRSAHESPESAYKSFKRNGAYWEGLFNHELNGEYYNWPRQRLPKTYQPNGYIDIIQPDYFMKQDNSLHGPKMVSFITPFAYEVDTMDDFKILKTIYENKK